MTTVNTQVQTAMVPVLHQDIIRQPAATCASCNDDAAAGTLSGNLSSSVSTTASLDAAVHAADQVQADQGANLIAMAVRSAVQQKASLSFRTQEGDLVKIRLVSSSVTEADYQSDGETGDSLSFSTDSSTRLALRIKGDINNDEQAAIQAVLDKVASLSASFFSGDVAGAFAAAADLQIDPAQLASFALKLRYREQTSVEAQFNDAAVATEPAPANTATPSSVTATYQKPVVNYHPVASSAVADATPAASANSAPSSAAAAPAADAAAAPDATNANSPVEPAPTAADTTRDTATAPNVQQIFAAITNFLANLFDSLQIGAPAQTNAAPAETSGTTGNVELNARFKLEFFFRVVQRIAEEPEDAPVVDEPVSSEDPVQTTDEKPAPNKEQTAAAIDMLGAVVDATLTALVEAEPSADLDSNSAGAAARRYHESQSVSNEAKLAINLHA
ncbi:MAG: hypothetical protein R3E77_13745 [Steroidobacteraceae bacterium]